MSATAPASDQGSAANEDDWRSAVSQSYRNTEVREIAKVLAALEPGATSASKLMLAMRFEDTIFKSATSLSDYRKKLTKRLKKLQKTYVPTNTVAASNKEELIKELRNKYGDALRYIQQHEAKAVAELRAKHGVEKANQLKQHIDTAVAWAAELGLQPPKHTKPNFNMTDEQVQKLQLHLERRMENIRSHVVKLADPDTFLQETLQRAEEEMGQTASKILAVNTTRRFCQLMLGSSRSSSGGKSPTALEASFDPFTLLHESLEKANVAVPPPTRSQRNDEQAALIHLNKMRAASTAVLAYMCVVDKSTAPSNVLVKTHRIASDGVEFVGTVMKTRRKESQEPAVCLEDAWNKAMENAATAVPPSTTTGNLDDESSGSFHSSLTVKPFKRPALRSRVLLTPGRKTPSSLLPALKRKRATLVRPPPHGEGSHLILEFGKAFVMTIYLVPLVVTIRAYSQQNEKPIDTRISGLSCASWTPLNEGLREQSELKIWGIKGGTYETIGHVVESRLEDASAQATQVLRRGFANADKEVAPEFEVEILEATALLDFLQNARKTYIPDWQDDDDV